MMKISFIVVWLVLAGVAVAAMFHLTFEVEKLEVRLHQVNRQIVREQAAIHVSQAEWSYLNRPQRLENLSKELLSNLIPVSADHFTTFERIPRLDQPEYSPASETELGFAPGNYFSAFGTITGVPSQ